MQTVVLVASVIIVALSFLYVMAKVLKVVTFIAIVGLIAGAIGAYVYGVPYVKSQMPAWKAKVCDYCESLITKK